MQTLKRLITLINELNAQQRKKNELTGIYCKEQTPRVLGSDIKRR